MSVALIYTVYGFEVPEDIISAAKTKCSVMFADSDELLAKKEEYATALLYIDSSDSLLQAGELMSKTQRCFFVVFCKDEVFEMCLPLQKLENVVVVSRGDAVSDDICAYLAKGLGLAIGRASEERLKQELTKQKHNALMGEMLSSITHQMRQPINAITAEMVNLKISSFLGEVDDAFVQTSVDKVTVQAEKMSKTITEFLNYFNPVRRKTMFSLTELGDELSFLYKEQLNRLNVRLMLTIGNELEVYGSKTSLTEVMANFVSNSLDAFEEKKLQGGTIEINALDEDSFVLLSIKDNAGGVKPELANKILTEYFTTKAENMGTGIGLSICKRIIESEFAGSIAAKNTDDGFLVEVNIPKINKTNLNKGAYK